MVLGVQVFCFMEVFFLCKELSKYYRHSELSILKF